MVEPFTPTPHSRKRQPLCSDTAIPPWFAYRWMYCTLRPFMAGVIRLKPGEMASHTEKFQWTLFHLVAGSSTVIGSSYHGQQQAQATWLSPPRRALADRAGPQGAVIYSALFEIFTSLGQANPLEGMDLPQAVACSDPTAWDEMLSGFVEYQPISFDHCLYVRAPLDRLVTSYIANGFSTGVLGLGRGGVAPEWLEDLAIWVIANARDAKLKPEHFTAQAGIGRATVFRAFRRWYGLSPGEFLIRERLRQAGRLLQSRLDKSVADIAMDCGFSATPHFCRRFRGLFGVTPESWRRGANPGQEP